MAEGKHPDTILVLQDFTQLNTTKGGVYQDLIIVWFTYDPTTKGNLHRHTHHYVTDEC